MSNPQIPIFSAPNISPGDDGDDLIDCYFQEVDSTNTFNLYQSDGTQITTYVGGTAQPVATNDDFTFDFDGLSWSITQFLISEADLSASGSWSAEPSEKADHHPDPDDPETGTFQAQGGGDPKLRAGASASA